MLHQLFASRTKENGPCGLQVCFLAGDHKKHTITISGCRLLC